MSSLIPYHVGSVLFFVATLYISLDTALEITHAFGPSVPPQSLHSVAVFVLTTVWPAIVAVLYFGIMTYIVLGVLRERRPMVFYLLSAVLFILSQLAYFLLSKVVCRKSKSKVDGSFIATVLETAAVGALFLGWRSITEESWDDDPYYR